MLNHLASLAKLTRVLKALPGKLDIKWHSPSIFFISASLMMSTSILKALPGKLDIKRHSPSNLYISTSLVMSTSVLKVSKGAKIRNQYNQVPHLTQWESDELTVRHHKQEPRGQPFPSRWPQGTFKQTHTKQKKTTTHHILYPQKSTALERLVYRFHGANLTLNSNVDPYT